MTVRGWSVSPRDRRFRRLNPLLEGSGEDDKLAAHPDELKDREIKEMALGSLEFLLRKNVARKLTELPQKEDFKFSELGIPGNDSPRLAFEGRIIEPARAAAGFRWASVKWKTTELYPYFLEALHTHDDLDYLKDHLPHSLTVSTVQPGDHYQTVLRAVLSNKTMLDDNVVRVVH